MARKTGHCHLRRIPLAEWPPEVPHPDPMETGTVPADAQTLANMGLYYAGQDAEYVYAACSVRDERRYASLPGEIIASDRGRPGARYERIPARVKAVVLRRRVWRTPKDEIPDIQPGERERVRAHVRARREAEEETSIELVEVPAGQVREDDIADEDGEPFWPVVFAGEHP